MSEKKTERIHLRVTPSEKEMIITRAFNAKMNMSEFIVALAHDKPIVIIDDVSRLVVEIMRVGTNVNQIAKVANSQKFIKREQLDKIENEMTGIQLTLAELIKKVNRSGNPDCASLPEGGAQKNGNL